MRCVVPGCENEVVRVLVNDSAAFGLCAHHVRRAILYLRPEQVRALVLPPGTP